jgi:hypothetical protein
VTDYAAVLVRRHKGREWKLEGDEYAGLTMLDDGDKPTKKSLEDAWPAVKAEIEAETNAKQAAAASARAKLQKLGLTDDEIAAITGI